MDKGTERRRHTRVRENDKVAVTILSAEAAPALEGKTCFCHTADLSVSGVRLCVDAELPTGSVLELRFAFSEPLTSFKMIGRSIWCRRTKARPPFEIGVEFKNCRPAMMAEWCGALYGKLEQFHRSL